MLIQVVIYERRSRSIQHREGGNSKLSSDSVCLHLSNGHIVHWKADHIANRGGLTIGGNRMVVLTNCRVGVELGSLLGDAGEGALLDDGTGNSGGEHFQQTVCVCVDVQVILI